MSSINLRQSYPEQLRLRAAWIGRRFDWTVALLSTWLVAGAYVDQWAHRHLADLESFFTPWHALLYSGFAAISAYLVWHLIRGQTNERRWRTSLPKGYLLSVGGVGLFLISGVADMIWHEVFGIEVGIEALLSPTHLLLAVGGGLIVSGPLRASWRRTERILDLPGVISACLVLALLAYFTIYAHPFVSLWGTTEAERNLGLSGILLHTLLISGLVFALLARFQLVPGTLTLLFGTTALFLSLMEYTHLMFFVGLATGAVADLLVRWLDPSPQRDIQFRIFAFGLPVLLWTGYFIALMASDGIAWTVHLYTGVIVQAGIFGWLLSYAVLPAHRDLKNAHEAEKTVSVV